MHAASFKLITEKASGIQTKIAKVAHIAAMQKSITFDLLYFVVCGSVMLRLPS